MARRVCLQELLVAIGGPLGEKSLWALLYQARNALEEAIKENGETYSLLITPESMLLSHGGRVTFLPGIPRSNSKFSAPELNQSGQCVTEKCYVYSLGMCLLAAMRNELGNQMIPQVSRVQDQLLLRMTDLICDCRPTLEDIGKNCNIYFDSESHACEEVDKLVSYVLGSSLECYSDSGNCKIDEADLEAEIQQVIKLQGTGSIENLYPPSYGSRGSSSLSLNSSGCYQRSFDTVNSRESMYSSLPVVFTPMAQEFGTKHNLSDDRLSYHQVNENYHRRFFPAEPKICYGSHFYTPSRRRRLAEKKLKGIMRKQARLHLSFHRSSSDGKKHSILTTDNSVSNDCSQLIDGMPPLPPTLTDNVVLDGAAFNDSEQLSQQKMPASYSFAEIKIPDISLNSTCSKASEDVNFSCPSISSACDLVHSKALGTSDTKCTDNYETTETTDSFSEKVDNQNESTSDHATTLPQESEIVLEENKSYSDVDSNGLHETKSSDQGKEKRSLRKLSNVLGPEFVIMSGVQVSQTELKNTDKRRSIPVDRRTVDVVMLNGNSIQFNVELSSTCHELFNQVIAHQSLDETHIFGLAVIKDYSELFLELDRKLMNYAPTGWASNSIHTVSKKKKNLPRDYTVYFRVKYYVENVNQLRLGQTRHLYYLQLRKDILEGRTHCHEESALKLAAYSLQIDKGDRNTHSQPYYHIEDYLPSKVISKLGRPVVQSILPGMHSELQGLCKEVAEFNFLVEAQTLPEYGVVFYEVAREKKGRIGSALLGLSVRGIVVYNVHKGTKIPNSHWSWKKIKKLTFSNKKFLVEVVGEKTVHFYTESYKKAQYLLHLSINYHRFHLLPRGPSDLNTCEDPSITSVEPMQDSSSGSKQIELSKNMIISVKVTKERGMTGLSLTSGRNKATGESLIYIKKLGRRLEDSELKERDILLKVNGMKVDGMSHKTAAELILSSISPIPMIFCRSDETQWEEECTPSQVQDAGQNIANDEN